MRYTKRSNMPLPGTNIISDDFVNGKEVFLALKSLVKKYAKAMEVRVNTPHQYEVWTEHEYRSAGFRPGRKRGVLFVGLTICKAHVGVYVYPLHINPELAEDLPLPLSGMWKRGSSFHVSYVDRVVLDQLELLLDKCFLFYKSQRWIFK